MNGRAQARHDRRRRAESTASQRRAPRPEAQTRDGGTMNRADSARRSVGSVKRVRSANSGPSPSLRSTPTLLNSPRKGPRPGGRVQGSAPKPRSARFARRQRTAPLDPAPRPWQTAAIAGCADDRVTRHAASTSVRNYAVLSER